MLTVPSTGFCVDGCKMLLFSDASTLKGSVVFNCLPFSHGMVLPTASGLAFAFTVDFGLTKEESLPNVDGNVPGSCE